VTTTDAIAHAKHQVTCTAAHREHTFTALERASRAHTEACGEALQARFALAALEEAVAGDETAPHEDVSSGGEAVQ
jgi:hypothetical protein